MTTLNEKPYMLQPLLPCCKKNFKFGSSWAYTTIFREILKAPGNEKLDDQFIAQHF
jgi:hypothetical protein